MKKSLNHLRPKFDCTIQSTLPISEWCRALKILPLFFILLLNEDVNCQAYPERLGNHILNTGLGFILNNRFGETDLLYEYIGISNGKSSLGLQAGIGLFTRLNPNRYIYPFVRPGFGYNRRIKTNKELGADLFLLVSEDFRLPEVDLSFGFINIELGRRIRLYAKINLARNLNYFSPRKPDPSPIRPYFGIGVRIGRYFGR